MFQETEEGNDCEYNFLYLKIVVCQNQYFRVDLAGNSNKHREMGDCKVKVPTSLSEFPRLAISTCPLLTIAIKNNVILIRFI